MEELSIINYKKVNNQIPRSIKKTPKTFRNYCNIKIEDHADIPAQDLDIIALALCCTADDLKNYTVNNQILLKKLKL